MCGIQEDSSRCLLDIFHPDQEPLWINQPALVRGLYDDGINLDGLVIRYCVELQGIAFYLEGVLALSTRVKVWLSPASGSVAENVPTTVPTGEFSGTTPNGKDLASVMSVGVLE